jgi:ribonuclease HI
MTIYAYTDGASRGNPGESGIGVILKDEGGEILFSGGGYIGKATNNIAEYRALLFCLIKAKELKCSELIVHSDSELMVKQLNGEYRVKNPNLREFFKEAKKMIQSASFQFTIQHVEREFNKDADLLANIGIDSKQPFSG